jgi:hypothetical protein
VPVAIVMSPVVVVPPAIIAAVWRQYVADRD